MAAGHRPKADASGGDDAILPARPLAVGKPSALRRFSIPISPAGLHPLV